MHQTHDEHAHRDLMIEEEPLDAVNQALSDALRVSFRILKGIMIVLLFLYLFSNVTCIESHEQALRLRLGALIGDVYDAGRVTAFPFPYEEIIRVPTRKASEIVINSHNFFRTPNEEGRPLDNISRSLRRGLNPVTDGALLTSDQGLVHVQWRIIYGFEDAADYVSNIHNGEKMVAAEELIRTIVETSGVHVASTMTAEEIIRTKVSDTQMNMKREINERLRAINSGLVVESVEMSEFTPPIQVRGAFNETQQAENQKQTKIRQAQQDKEKSLNEVAGAPYRELEKVFASLDEAELTGDEQRLAALRTEMDRLLLTKVEGVAGERVKRAQSVYSRIVGQIKADLELYQTLIPEYERNPRLLIARLWEEAREKILTDNTITKIYRPFGLAQIRIQISPDQDLDRIEEMRKRRETEEDITSGIYENHHVPVGVFES